MARALEIESEKPWPHKWSKPAVVELAPKTKPPRFGLLGRMFQHVRLETCATALGAHQRSQDVRAWVHANTGSTQTLVKLF